MRLYCLIPNYVFFEKVAGNTNPFMKINVDDLAGTFHDFYNYNLPPFLQYNDKEDWVDNSICTFTTPAQAKNYLGSNNVMISFEIQDEDYLKLNGDELYNYIAYKNSIEDRMLNLIEMSDEDKKSEKLYQMNERFEKFENNKLSKVSEMQNYYEGLVVVPEIKVSSIKSYFVSKSNKQFNKFRELRDNKMIVENKCAEMGEWNVFWHCKAKIWKFEK